MSSILVTLMIVIAFNHIVANIVELLITLKIHCKVIAIKRLYILIT